MPAGYWPDAWFNFSLQTAFTLHGPSERIPMVFLRCGLDTTQELLTRISCAYSQDCYKPRSHMKMSLRKSIKWRHWIVGVKNSRGPISNFAVLNFSKKKYIYRTWTNFLFIILFINRLIIWILDWDNPSLDGTGTWKSLDFFFWKIVITSHFSLVYLILFSPHRATSTHVT